MRKMFVPGVLLLLVQIPLLALTFIQSDVFGGPNHDNARRVAFAPDGGVYVAGTTLSGDGNTNAFLRKYDANDVLQWEQAYGLPSDPTNGLDDDLIEGLAVGSDGSAYMAGMLGTGVLFLAKFETTSAGDMIWSKVGGPGFGAGRDVAVSPDDTAVFVGGNMLADTNDPNVFGGFAFVAEFTAEGKAGKANSWGSSPEFSASAESLVVSGDRVVAAGFVGPGPHELGRASNSAKNAATHLIIPTGVVENLPTLLEAQDGQILPFDSTSLGGDDAFALWTQR